MTVKDGNVLVANIFASLNLHHPISNIKEWKGFINPKDIENPGADIFFNMSSTIPSSYLRILQEGGFSLSPQAKMLFPLKYAKDFGSGFVMSQVD